MPYVNPEQLVALQRNPEGIRNICILAHVDHGKTSLTDALIATNGIISPKLAGKIRYLDSRPDEQLRGITMESSAISLYFSMLRRPVPGAELEKKDYLINLIDSPGHIDFSSEVSTASRLCDGAVVLVDAVEGVCSQTVTVLRQAWVEHMKPILVINKLDRLINELKFTPHEAYIHLRTLLEQVNAILGSFFQGERMEEDLNWRERVDERVAAAAAKEQERADRDTTYGTTSVSVDTESMASGSHEFEEKDDEDIYFAPEKNNVIFSSAIDGWAFTVRQFASLYEKKLGIKRTAMEKVLWGDFYLDPKTKKVLGPKHLKGRNLKPMFVQLVLEQIWNVYEATTGGDKGLGDPTLRDKITKSLNIKLQPYILRSKDTRVLLTTIFSEWLPLSTALLVSVIESLPSPPAAQENRLPTLISSSPGATHVDPTLRDAMIKSKSTKDDPVIVYVSKMVSVPESELPENKRRGGAMTGEEAREMGRRKREEIAKARTLEDAGVDTSVHSVMNALGATSVEGNNTGEVPPDPEHLIGFARIFSGTLSIGDSIYVIPPKFTPAHPHNEPEPVKIKITALYLLMGRSLEPLESVHAGVIFGIGGLEGHILKSGTLCSQLEGSVNLAGVSMGSKPIVRVALEPVNPADLEKMIQGLRLLVQSDPCAEYEQFESGEHVLLTAGELHLERCLTDLRDRFARCEIQAGEPIVPYRETTIRADEMKPPVNKELGRGTLIAVTTSKQVVVKLRVLPLPAEVTEFLGKNSGAIKRLYSDRQAEAKGQKTQSSDDTSDQNEEDDVEAVTGSGVLSLEEFKIQLQETFKNVKGPKDIWINTVDQIAAFGPRRTGPNLLVDATQDGIFGRFLQENASEETQQAVSDTLQARDFADKIGYAFQIATAQGPLCNEPVQGLAVLIEEVTVSLSADEEPSARDRLGRLTGEVIKSVQQGIKDGFLDWSPRLLLAMYSCEVQSSTEALGRVYDVLTRRRGRVLSESMKEGTPFYTILSLLPVAESFGFAEEIRKRTSGAAAPQLIFQGYEILDEDPFWVPFTEDDLEDLGELADKENVAKRYMDAVRKRKGLVIAGQKLVKDAEKQKTLKR